MNFECDYTKPESVLQAFFEEMNAWEIESFPQIKAIPRDSAKEEISAVYQPIAEKLDAIFRKYCTTKDRKQGRQNCTAVSSPPDYDPATQTIAEIINESSRRVSIDTIGEKRFGNKFRYILLKKDGKWLIDNKKFYTFDGRLEKDFL